MARPKRYETNAQRQAAWRARRQQEEALALDQQAEAERVEQIADELQLKATRAEIEQSGLTEESYVAREVEITRQQLEEGTLKDEDADGNPLHRLERSERYARFRWQGVQDGSIASL